MRPAPHPPQASTGSYAPLRVPTRPARLTSPAPRESLRDEPFEYADLLDDDLPRPLPPGPRDVLQGSPSSSRSNTTDIVSEAMGTLVASVPPPQNRRVPLRSNSSQPDLRAPRGPTLPRPDRALSPSGPPPTLPLPPVPERVTSPRIVLAAAADARMQALMQRVTHLEALWDSRPPAAPTSETPLSPLPQGWRRIYTPNGPMAVSRTALEALARSVALDVAPVAAPGAEPMVFIDVPYQALPLLVHATSGYLLATLSLTELWLLRDAAHRHRLRDILGHVHAELQRRGSEAGAQLLLSRDTRLRRVHLFEQLCHGALNSHGRAGPHLQQGQNFLLQLALTDVPTSVKKGTPLAHIEISGPQHALGAELHLACEAFRAWLEPFKYTWTSAYVQLTAISSASSPSPTPQAKAAHPAYLEIQCVQAGA